MKALTLWQPWAWAIAHAGKRIENRTWEPPPDVVGQTIAIHASKKLDAHGLDALADILAGTTIAVPEATDLAHGAVVAIARVTGFVDRSTSRWFSGPIGWELADVEAVDPIPCRGAQGLWVLPPDVERKMSAALRRT